MREASDCFGQASHVKDVVSYSKSNGKALEDFVPEWCDHICILKREL